MLLHELVEGISVRSSCGFQDYEGKEDKWVQNGCAYVCRARALGASKPLNYCPNNQT